MRIACPAGWNPSLRWRAESYRSSGHCSSMVQPYWAAHTCYRLSPLTCSPYTMLRAKVMLHKPSCCYHCHQMTNIFYRFSIYQSTDKVLFQNIFVRRRRCAVCFTRAKHCPWSWHVCPAGAALHRLAQRYSFRYTQSILYKLFFFYTHLIQPIQSRLVNSVTGDQNLFV